MGEVHNTGTNRNANPDFGDQRLTSFRTNLTLRFSIPTVKFTWCDSYVGLQNAHSEAGVSLKWWSLYLSPSNRSPTAQNNHDPTARVRRSTTLAGWLTRATHMSISECIIHYKLMALRWVAQAGRKYWGILGSVGSGTWDTGMGRSIETRITSGGGKIRVKATGTRQKSSQHYNSLT